MAYKKFPAKVLLFGEHIILQGATAISIPISHFGGHWAWANETKAPSLQGRLREFSESDALLSVPGLDVNAFRLEIDRGIWFHTNIPSGYGLGSSGVICAAIYERYCHEKATDPAELKEIFAQMETFFHGRSSGIDPLTSYLNTTLLVSNQTEIELIKCPDWRKEMDIFLLDTRQIRQTGSLVTRFVEQCQHPEFHTILEDHLMEVHEPMILQFLKNDFEGFWENLGKVSAFQWNYQRYMIPDGARERWLRGLDRRDYFVKMCGAGGGGYMLLFVKNKAYSPTLAKLHRLTEIVPPP